MYNLFRGNLSRLLSSQLKTNSVRQASNLFEPDYLDALKPKHPIYPCVNFQITGYDFAVLESFHRFLYRTADSYDFDVSECWAVPAKDLHVTKLKANSETVESEFKLKIYERNMQVYNLSANFYPVYLRLIQAALPEGVTLKVVEHQPDIHEEIRYVPDTDLKQLQDELEELRSTHKTKKKSSFRRKI
ncbi:uncharacterized protein LOC116341336 [Contarinia nasturtii]|uniref:uncharacterized protein LOC116341336 n=1 Tax=Contarinia nasturtii TaxID=265458 RepID=UPI0012D4003E|nr:uncharacterized protein LOC116341336 [Contarinia nasturtii]